MMKLLEKYRTFVEKYRVFEKKMFISYWLSPRLKKMSYFSYFFFLRKNKRHSELVNSLYRSVLINQKLNIVRKQNSDNELVNDITKLVNKNIDNLISENNKLRIRNLKLENEMKRLMIQNKKAIGSLIKK